MPIFGRVLTAMASPMHDDRSLDLDGAQQLAVHLVEHGSDGLVVCGTTGESPTLDHGETLDIELRGPGGINAKNMTNKQRGGSTRN